MQSSYGASLPRSLTASCPTTSSLSKAHHSTCRQVCSRAHPYRVRIHVTDLDRIPDVLDAISECKQATLTHLEWDYTGAASDTLLLADCARRAAANTACHGDYWISTQDKTIELVWLDARTAFVTQGTSAVGEPRLRHVIEVGGGFASSFDVADLLTHTDLASSAWGIALPGAIATQTTQGVGMSVDADDTVHARIYFKGDPSAALEGLTISMTVDSAQVDQWIDFVVKQHSAPVR